MAKRDLVAVFQAGEYDDDASANSTFEEGDWNGDGDFDSGDLVLAFQAGNYVANATKLEIAAAVDSHFSGTREKLTTRPTSLDLGKRYESEVDSNASFLES